MDKKEKGVERGVTPTSKGQKNKNTGPKEREISPDHVVQKPTKVQNSAPLRTVSTAMSGPSIASMAQRHRPHTVSKPPTSSPVMQNTKMEDKMDRLERMMLTQSKQQHQFQCMVMAAMHNDNDGMSDEFDTESFATEEDFASWFDEDDHAAAESVADAADIATATAKDTSTNKQDSDVHEEEPKGFAARFCQPADSGPPLDNDMAQSLKFLLHSKIEDTTITETCDKYPCPNNAQALRVPKVNPVIWDSISPKARSRDLKLQRVQKPLVKGITALAKTVPNGEEAGIQDTLALLSNANYELLCLRKEMLKPELNPKYVHLCKASVMPTEYLFGDVGKAVKELDEQMKASLRTTKYSTRYSPYQRGNRYFHSRKHESRRNPFLGYNPRSHTNLPGYSRRNKATYPAYRQQHQKPKTKSRTDQVQEQK